VRDSSASRGISATAVNAGGPAPVDRSGRLVQLAAGGPAGGSGTYKVALSLSVDGKETPVGQPQTFQAVPVTNTTVTAEQRSADLAFQQTVGRLQRAVLGSIEAARGARQQLELARKALFDTPKADPTLTDDVRALDRRLREVLVALTGDAVVGRYSEPVPPSIVDRSRPSSAESCRPRCQRRRRSVTVTCWRRARSRPSSSNCARLSIWT